MTRHPESSTVSTVRAAPSLPAPDATAGAVGPGWAVTDHWTSVSQQAALSATSWLDHLQQLGMQAASTWFEALTAAALEFDHAEAPDQWLAVPARLVDRQWHLALRCQADMMQGLSEAQARWLDPEREPAKAVARPVASAWAG